MRLQEAFPANDQIFHGHKVFKMLFCSRKILDQRIDVVACPYPDGSIRQVRALFFRGIDQ